MRETSIYEVVNLTRRESLVAVIEEAPAAFARRLGPPRPAMIDHWGAGEEIFVEVLASAMSRQDAIDFLQMFLKSTGASNWKTISWIP